MSRPRTQWLALSVTAFALGGAKMGVGFPRYYDPETDGCRACHGWFTNGDSPKGTVFPESSKHAMHAGSAYMGTHCSLCHSTGDDRNPCLGSSDGKPEITGVGCNGCHGRDYGGSIGVSGVGLRAHHALHGVTGCLACHAGDPSPHPESVFPSYYGTGDTRVDDPCNTAPAFEENWSMGDTSGLDNDGDGLFDEGGPDCGGPVGTPVVSEWGLIVFTLLLLTGAKVSGIRRWSRGALR